MLVDSQAPMMPGVDLAGGPAPAVPPQWPPSTGPLPGPATSAGRPGACGHSHCGQASRERRRLAGRPGHPHQGTTGALEYLNLVPE
jgi:hypothetical protein